jgi:CRISPR/Cas system-associated exonuclease Cas4 (RecB family)
MPKEITFRYSTIMTAYQCLKKYELRHIKGIEPQVPDSADLHFGTALHMAIATSFEGGDVEGAFRMYWGSLDPAAMKYTRLGYEDLKNCGEVLLSKWQRLHKKNYTPLHIEKTLEFSLGGFKMSGTPDFIGEYKGVLSIVDWKSSGYNYDHKKLLSDEQLWLYVHAAKECYGLDIRQVVYAPFIKTDNRIQTPLTLEVTPEKLKTQLDNVVLVMQDIIKRDTFPMNKSNCKFCDYFDICYNTETNK